ncbi:MAG: DNA polymerase, partial [Acidobacteriota bacterium]
MNIVSNETLRYNAIDAYVTEECRESFWKDLRDEKNNIDFLPTYDHTIALLEPLMYMMTRGIRVDHDELNKTRHRITSELQTTLMEIEKACGRSVNPLSSKEVQAYFYIEKGVKPYYKKNTKGESAITTDDNALQRIARGTSGRRPYPEASLMQKYRSLNKLKGTYLDISF